MKARLVIFSCVLFMGVIAGVAQADVQQWPGTKWFQPPEMGREWGYDIASNWDFSDSEPKTVVADDWRCTDGNSPVKGFRWWGSYFNDYSIDDISGFYISIHGDVPAGAAPSHPQPPILHEQYFDIADLGYEECGYQRYIGDDFHDDPVFEYFALFDVCFEQEGTPENPVVYWVNIVALVPGVDGNVWGWHTSSSQNIDDAVSLANYNFDTGEYSEFTALEYAGHGSLDMAFEVIPEPGTLLLALPGLIGLAAVIRRRK
jgi:hypothetical protein